MQLSKTIKQNISLAWPLAINALLSQSMTIIDLYMVAKLGETSVAAMGFATAVLAFMIGIQNSLANGTQLLTARAFGKSNSHDLSITLSSGLILILTASIGMMIILLLFSSTASSAVLSNMEAATLSTKYLLISTGILITSALSQWLIVFFNASGKTKVPLIGLILEIPINISLSLILIYGYFGMPALGISGAAIGSLCALIFRCIFLYIRFLAEKSTLLLPRWFQYRTQNIREHLAQCTPIAMNFVTLSGGLFIYQLLYAQLPIAHYAAITLILPWLRIGMQFINAWAHASAIQISQIIGANRQSELKKFLAETQKVTLCVSLLLSFLFAGFSFLIPNFYSELGLQTLDALTTIAPIYIATPLIRALNTLSGHSLRALGYSLDVLRVHFVTQWLIALPILFAAIWLQLPLFFVFSIMLIEELLKLLPFRSIKRHYLNNSHTK